jgi:hypothetical protein
MLIRDVNIHRRGTQTQDAGKSKEDKSASHEDDSKESTESEETKPTEAYIRPARSSDEHKQESSSPRPTGEITEAHKDESKHRDK